jgi:hypothetical protein
MLNKIGIAEQTWGTETSKYPEEEKEKSIPPVAASEQGKAQTVQEARVKKPEARKESKDLASCILFPAS